MSSAAYDAWVADARAVDIGDYARTRSYLKLTPQKDSLVGACPHCGGEDRFVVTSNHTKKVFRCRGCQDKGHKDATGDVIALVMFLDGCTFNEAVGELTGRPKPPPEHKKGKLGDIDAEYDYTDTAGRLLFQAVRYKPKAFRQRRPNGKGGWIWNLDGVQLVPYRLPAVIAAVRAGQRVHLVEGEKDVATAEKLGLVATCAPGGVGMGWRAEYDQYFADADVVITPDNDKDARKGPAYARTIAEHLSGVARRVRWLTLPPAVKDLTEWVEAGGTREQLEALVEAAPDFEAPPGSGDGQNKGNGKTHTDDDTINAEQLMRMEFPAVKYVVPGYIVEGLTVFGGKPKAGKSWWAYDVCIAVAVGGKAMGTVQCEQGDVLYLCLEDNRRRVKDRINVVRPYSDRLGGLERLSIRTRAPRIGEGLLDELEKWRSQAANPRLIVIDVWIKVRPTRQRGADLYAADYAAAAPLQQYATEHGLGLVIILHTRKMEATDPLESISGTNGITGAADTVLVLTRSADGSKIYGRGRDIADVETALAFNGGQWTTLGSVEEVHRSEQRRKILAALKDAGKPLSPKDLSDITHIKPGNVRVMLLRMGRDGEVVAEGGRYRPAPEQGDLL